MFAALAFSPPGRTVEWRLASLPAMPRARFVLDTSAPVWSRRCKRFSASRSSALAWHRALLSYRQ